jgi:hypothetical protein
MVENSGIDVDVDALDAREVPVPHHSWETAKRVIQKACNADEHDWVELTGLDPTGYWRECHTCGIADVTAAALGQDVETPNADRQERD